MFNKKKEKEIAIKSSNIALKVFIKYLLCNKS